MLDRTAICTSRSISYSAPNSPQTSSHISIQGVDPRRQISGFYATARLRCSENGFWHQCRRPINYLISRGSSVLCRSSKNSTSSKEVARTCGACSNPPREQDEDEKCALSILPLKIIENDAKFVNKRAQSDIVLLSRGILCLDARARQDVALLGSEFLKLDARAREDTEKIDNKMKKKAERLHHIAMILKDKAKSRLKTAADRHWSDGALEADLRLADSRAKRRAMEDTLMALEFVKNIHDMMISKVYKLKIQSPVESIMLERNGKTLDSFPGEVSNKRVEALQEAYWSMASALSEADGIDYTDPEELELLITTLIDLDAMDGKSSVSLLAECSSSPDVETRRALANALAAAPSMWTLGNAGMGALQRLAEDSNPAVADAASRAIYELKRQWEIEEGDSWRFTMYRDSNSTEDVDKTRDDDDGAC